MCILWLKAACRCAPERGRPQLVGSCFSRPKTNSGEEKSGKTKSVISHRNLSQHRTDLEVPLTFHQCVDTFRPVGVIMGTNAVLAARR